MMRSCSNFFFHYGYLATAKDSNRTIIDILIGAYGSTDLKLDFELIKNLRDLNITRREA